ncbi:MAG: zinc-binding dehydrogenase [Deltaproteobacteria bacterium]|nr:zinc-binding dehydrogenase [Deltaproteobacteria bacterium]
MRAVALREHGGRDKLLALELPEPEAGAGQVRVRIRACALNHLDLWVRRGLPHLRLTYPHILGADIAGEVDAVGPGVTGVTVGQRCLVAPGLSCGRCQACLAGRDNFCRGYGILGESVSGGYAERIAIPAANLLPYPGDLPFEQAAALPLTFQTAWQMLVERARVQPGETVLVLAAASGVGVAAVQIAKLYGARVIAAASSAEKLAVAESLGADHLINYKEQKLAPEVRRLTDKRGVDVVFEHVGAATWEDSLRACAWGGRVVTCGASSGFDAPTDLRHVFFRQLSILGSTMGSKAVLFDVVKHVAAGRLRPVVGRVLPLAEAAEAHRLLEEHAVAGKVVLVP